jgi:hypothetical protein
LRRAGFSRNQVNLLSPDSTEEQIHTIPTSETEQPGTGGASGGMLGGALGVAGGLELGTAVTALIPGVGRLCFGAGGADEIFFYEDALRHGRSVVLALAADRSEARRAR